MLMTKVKIVAAACLAIAVAAAGVGTWSQTTRAAEEPSVPQQAAPNSQINAHNQRGYPLGQFSDPKAAMAALAPDKHQQDGIAWGEKAHGLQAGIAFRRGDQESYEVGQSVTFVVYLRNVSDKKISFSYIETLLGEWMPLVHDAEGRRLAVAPGPIHLGMVPIVHRNLKAGQQIILGYPWFRTRPLGWRGEVLGPTCCAEPGRYQVGYTGLSLRLSDGKDISLGTKKVELDIRKRETTKADGVNKKAPLVKKPAISPIGDAEKTPLYYYLSRSFHIPVNLDPKRSNSIQELILCVSGDQGQTWEQADKKPSNGNAFTFHAPADGTYWFVVQEVDKQGRCVPPDPSRVKPTIRICVDTTPPSVALQGRCDKKTISLTWAAEDANLDNKSVRQIQIALHKDGPWSDPIISGPLPNTSHQTWNCAKLHLDNLDSDFFVRLQVRDKAGNDGHAVAYIKVE